MGSHIILGTGNYAKTPFFFERTYVNLYSIEELCYCLVQNAEFLDQEIVSEKLARWLDEECGLSQLAHALYALINQKGSPSAYVGMILEYAGLYPEEQIAKIETIVRSNAGLSPYEKQKMKADYLLQNKRYVMAIEQYHILYASLPEEERKLRAEIKHNLGVADSALFLFEDAANAFLQAYEIDGNEDSLLQHLLAYRMGSKEKDYIEYIAANPSYYEISLQAERLYGQANSQFDATEENRMLSILQISKDEGGNTAGSTTTYYSEIEEMTTSLKESYRQSVAK